MSDDLAAVMELAAGAPRVEANPKLLAACLRLGVDTASTPDALRTFWAEHAGARTLLTPTQHEWLRAAANARRQALRGEAP